jgi:DNA-binding CsgD family transcriptional regulator
MLNDQQLLNLYINFTLRQRDVLQLVSQGLTIRKQVSSSLLL